MSERLAPGARIVTLIGRSAVVAWIAAGLLLPGVIGVVDIGQLVAPTLPLALVLVVFAVAGSNVELRFSMQGTDGDGPVFSPVGVPIVLAVIACPPAQAMVVAAMGYLLDRATWQHSRRTAALETAGLAAMSTGGAALIVSALGLSFDGHASSLVAAIVGSAAFLGLDALTYAFVYQIESRSGTEILRYFLRAAPVDVGFTAVAVALAGPFHDEPLVLALVLVGCQLAIYALYRMATSESRYREQSHHLRDTFGRYVPESIVEQLAESGAQVSLGGEGRDVSVMFCDIRGFTTWAEGHTPEQVVKELNGLLGSLAELVLQSGGTLDKFTGDGLMAFWGAPLEQPDHAERACRTAFEMQDLLAARARAAEMGSCTAFRIGIGISSGPVVVGNVGHVQRLEYTAIGDTVNLAARLEQSTKELGVTTAIAHETWEQLPSTMQARCPETATVTVRGRSKPVRVHEIAGPAGAVDVFDAGNVTSTKPSTNGASAASPR